MTNFDNNEAFVWVWLPNAIKPVVAGKLEVSGEHHDFYYGQSYIERSDAISFSISELPLLQGKRFTSKHKMHHAIHDSLPDAWGRRVLNSKYQAGSLSHLDMLLLSSSDRIGALHFQNNSTEYCSQYENHATLEQLLEGAALIEEGATLPEELANALIHGTSIGGARPKALINETSNLRIFIKTIWVKNGATC